MSLLEGDDVTLDDLRRAQRMGYGVIPGGMRGARIARNASYGGIVDPVSCPNCGAPRRSSTCAYCSTRFADGLPDPDDLCPRCGYDLESDDLVGDGIFITITHCRRCGWEGRKQWRR